MSEEEKTPLRDNAIVDYAKTSKLIVADMEKNGTLNVFFKKFTKEQVRRFLESPQASQKQLREISRFLYVSSQHYKRLVLYFSNLLLFRYYLKPIKMTIANVDKDKLTKAYLRIADTLETMSIPHEFGKIMKTCFKEDVFYGYVLSAKDSFYIKQLDPDYCQISSVDDGVYNFKFNMQLFDNHNDLVEKYPDEFKEKYKTYKSSKKIDSWIELDSENTICIKVEEDIIYPIPPFIGLIEALIDLDEFKQLTKTKTKIDNYKVLTMEIPLRKESEDNDDYVLTFDEVMKWHNFVAGNLPEMVGLISSPMPINDINFEKDRAETDNIAKSVRDFWAASGVNQHLFGTEKTSSTGLDKSIKVDEIILFSILRQFERWTNRRIKQIGGNFKFFAGFLNMTEFNRNDVIKEYSELAKFGVPVKEELCAATGLTPADLVNKPFFELDVLNLNEKFEPLRSSHTQGDAPSGAPKVDDDELSDEGLKTRDDEKNADD